LISPLQYQTPDDFPPKVILQAAASSDEFSMLSKIFRAYPPNPKLGAEYAPKELIWWL